MKHHTNSNSIIRSDELFRFAGEAKGAFAKNVAHHVRCAAHDCVSRRVRETLSYVVPQEGVGSENFVDKLRNAPLVLGAKALRRC